MHLAVFERIRVVDLYNSIQGNMSFTKKCIIVAKQAEKEKIKISDRAVRDLICKAINTRKNLFVVDI
jgi:hypothetical protein